ncbi:MAG: DUF3842 family protein [Firmicutes bacterium]|nr:DUF3842 family protein [Bacillota bacterium]
MQIIVIDGMGGGIGSQVVSQLQTALATGPNYEILALGTNAAATTKMVRAGAHRGATGENAICFCVPKARVIVGPLGIIMPNGMLGEITPKIATAVVASPAKKFLLPISQTHVELVGMSEVPLSLLLKEVVERVRQQFKVD